MREHSTLKLRGAARALLTLAGGLLAFAAAAQADVPAEAGTSAAELVRYRWLRSPDEGRWSLEQNGQDHCQNPQPGQNGQTGQNDGSDAATRQAELRRHVSHRWAVSAKGQPFALDARYGRVRLVPSGRAEIRVEAELVARSETDAGARQVLDALGVDWLDYDARTGGVAVASRFGPLLQGRAGGARYEINYTVWLPATTPLRITNAFGDVTLAGDWRGATDLAVDYGNLATARLNGPRNTVRIANGECTIPYATRASIVASYAHLRFDEGETVDLRTIYADVDLGTIGDLTVHSQYGDVALGTVQNLRGSSGYSRFRVDKLDQALDMALRHCPDFVVRDTGPDFRQINLDGGYSSIQLGFADAPGFRFAVSTEQGQLVVDPRLVRVLSEENGPQGSDVLGVFGSAVPARNAGNVNIKVRYGTVRFSK